MRIAPSGSFSVAGNVFFFFLSSGYHRDLHNKAHSFPTRRSSDLFMLHSLSSKSLASQSSSSGWLGGCPKRPKSLGDSASPWPKCCCHSRFASTRDGKGLSRDTIHFANSVRRPVVFGERDA